MSEFDMQVEELLEQASGLENGPSRVMLLEEAVRLADIRGDIETGYQTRMGLIEAATFSGYPEKALVAFSWCLAQYDKDPESFDEFEILWRYKWVLENFPGFPQISRQQISDTLEDMTRHYQRAGASLRPVYKLRCEIAHKMGDGEESQRYRGQWQKAARDWLADCHACDANAYIEYLLFAGDDEALATQAEPILSGMLHCAEIPHQTLGTVLLPLLRLGRVEEAMAHHHKGYRLICRNRDFLTQFGCHITFLVVTDNLAKALKLFEKHLPWALEAVDASRRFDFLLGARFLLDRLRETGKRTVKLRLPDTFDGYQINGKYEVGKLLSWFEEALQELANRFDERNGNDYFSRRIASSRQWHDLISPFPLRKSARSNDEPAA